MYKNKSNDNLNNIYGREIEQLRLQFPEKTFQRKSAGQLVHRIISNQPYDLPEFPSAALSSVNDATASPPSSALR